MRISDWSSDVCSSDLVGGFVFVGEVAGDGFEDIDGRYQSFDRAELIDDDDQLAACRLKRLYQVEYAYGFVHQDGRPQAFLVQRFMRDQICNHVLGAAYAHDIVQRAAADRKESVRRIADFLADIFGIVVKVYPTDIRARRHDGMHVAVRQPQYAADHIAFFPAKGSVVRRRRGIGLRRSEEHTSETPLTHTHLVSR